MNVYFERRAQEYLRKSHRGIWGWFRKREFAAILKLLKPVRGESLIEIGSGAGYYTVPLREDYGLRVTAVDASEEMLKALSQRRPDIETRHGRIEQLEIDGIFDKVLAAGVFEFVEEIESAADRCGRLVRKDGLLVVLVPASGIVGRIYADVHRLSGCPTFIRTISFYRDLFARRGFAAVESVRCTPISLALSFRRMN